MIDFGDVFHIGIRVPDVPAAMKELTASMGLHWGQQHHIDITTWVPGEGYQDLELNLVYSIEGPVHIELLQGTGIAWDPAFGTGVHHVGFFADVGDVTDKLVSTGWTIEMAHLSPEERCGGWSLVRSPSGLLVEPVSSETRERFARYLEGESLI
jgi:hypothetical protein